MAVVIGHIMGIKHYLPDAEITLLSGNVEVDKFYETFGVKVCPHPWYTRQRKLWKDGWRKQLLETNSFLSGLPKFFSFLLSLSKLSSALLYPLRKKESPFQDFDVVLDTIPDRLNESFHGFVECGAVLFVIFMAEKTIKKPILVGPSSIGSINSPVLKFLTRLVLNNVYVVATRDQRSFCYVKNLGINKPKVLSLSDMAFLLPSASEEKIISVAQEIGLDVRNHAFVGVVPRVYVWQTVTQYYDLVAQFIDWLVSQFGVYVCLIPMETGFGVYWNDEITNKEIYQRVHQKNAVHIIPGKCDPTVIKGLIGNFEFVVSWKFHGALLPSSALVPTLALSYGEKYNELFRNQLCLPDLLIDVRGYGPDALLSLLKRNFEKAWFNKEEIKRRLSSRVECSKALSLSYSKVVCDIVEKSENRR
ncbi:MAG: polysaccharide pyruvyl transferase family protein [Candidatus Bathyarchaeia archaeon]